VHGALSAPDSPAKTPGQRRGGTVLKQSEQAIGKEEAQGKPERVKSGLGSLRYALLWSVQVVVVLVLTGWRTLTLGKTNTTSPSFQPLRKTSTSAGKLISPERSALQSKSLNFSCMTVSNSPGW